MPAPQEVVTNYKYLDVSSNTQKDIGNLVYTLNVSGTSASSKTDTFLNSLSKYVYSGTIPIVTDDKKDLTSLITIVNNNITSLNNMIGSKLTLTTAATGLYSTIGITSTIITTDAITLSSTVIDINQTITLNGSSPYIVNIPAPSSKIGQVLFICSNNSSITQITTGSNDFKGKIPTDSTNTILNFNLKDTHTLVSNGTYWIVMT